MPRQFTTDQRTPIYTSLPTSPVDGQVIDYLASAADGVVWRLRYRAASASAYKWEFIGGSSLHSQDDTERQAVSTTPTTFAGCSITIPLAGDYRITGSSWVELRTGSQPYSYNYIRVTGVNDYYGSLIRGPLNAGSRYDAANGARTIHVAAIALGTVITMAHTGDGTNTAYINSRTIDVVPVRVG